MSEFPKKVVVAGITLYFETDDGKAYVSIKDASTIIDVTHNNGYHMFKTIKTWRPIITKELVQTIFRFVELKDLEKFHINRSVYKALTDIVDNVCFKKKSYTTDINVIVEEHIASRKRKIDSHLKERIEDAYETEKARIDENEHKRAQETERFHKARIIASWERHGVLHLKTEAKKFCILIKKQKFN